MKDLCAKNYKIWIKEIQPHSKKWRYHVISELEKLVLLKDPCYQKQSTDLLWFLSNYPNNIFHRARTNNPKMHRNHKRPRIAKAMLRKKNKAGSKTLPDFKTIQQNYSNQNGMPLAQKQIPRSMEQNREPRSKPTHWWEINLQKRGGPNIQWGKDSLFSK